MTAAGTTTFVEMAREFPVRTGVFTLVPLAFALTQLANSYVYGESLLYTGAFAVAVVAYAILVNRYHLAAFERSRLSRAGERQER